MITGSLKRLIDKLYEKTNKKAISWSRFSRPEEFALELNSGSVTIYKSRPDNSTLTSIELTVYDKQRMKIEHVVVHHTDDRDDYDLLNQFHFCIKRSYYRVDDTINGLINEINEINSLSE